jgi:hypothetical protein
MATHRSGSRSSSEALNTSRGTHLHLAQVQVGLIEAVEQHQGAGPSVRQPLRQVGRGAIVGAELDGHRDANVLPDGFQNVHRLLLDVFAAHHGVGRHIVDVQFQRIGARLLDVLGVTPASRRVDTPFRLPMMGISSASLALRMMLDILFLWAGTGSLAFQGYQSVASAKASVK